MTTSSSGLLERLEQVVTHFNRGSLDLPDGLVHHDARFRLNGVAYEDTLGRPADDPLVRLIARGPGAYRFLAKALRYAVPDARLSIGQLQREGDEAGFVLRGPARLAGVLRGGSDTFDGSGWLDLHFDAGDHLIALGLVIDEALVDRIRAARAD